MKFNYSIGKLSTIYNASLIDGTYIFINYKVSFKFRNKSWEVGQQPPHPSPDIGNLGFKSQNFT